MKKTRKIIFLDIDGVLQPHGKQDRFSYDLVQLTKDLAAKYNNDEYLEMDKYDLGAVYYDWDEKPVERLKKLCAEVPAEIVISSDWRIFSPLSRLKDYFKLHDLDRYVTGTIDRITGKDRCGEITEYLKNNKDIHRFVILDDDYISEFKANYPKQFVHCHNIFDEDGYKKALSILTKKRERKPKALVE
jgi:hypothetical protein